MTKLRLLAGTVSLLALAASAAHGQVSVEPATIEEIVVTAQKREQSLQDVPMTVTALTEAAMAKAGIFDMAGVANQMPSLKTIENTSPAAQSYRIRGIGSDPNTPTFEPEVGLFIDGVYLPRSGLGVNDLVDIARIEVLEGPQSTLYGKNVAAGVINVVSKEPSHSFEASLGAQVSTLEGGRDATATRLSGSISGPLGDRVRARLAAVASSQQHLVENLRPNVGNANGLHRYAVRGEVAVDLSATATLRVAAAHSEVYDTDATNSDLLYYSGATNTFRQLQTALGPAFGISPCPDNDPSNRRICTTDPARNTGRTDILSATLDMSLGENTLTSITARSAYKSTFTNNDVTQTLLPLVNYVDTQEGESFSQEIRLTSPSGDKFEWLVGAYYLQTQFQRGDQGKTPTFVLGAAAPFVPLSPSLPAAIKIGQPGDQGRMNSTVDTDYYAVFGQGTWSLSEEVAVTAGLRWQTEDKQGRQDNSFTISPLNPLGLNLISASLTPTSVNATYRDEMSGFVGNLTGQYRPNADSMLYLTYSHGAKSGGFNLGFGNAPIASRPFGKETVDNYEAGVKLDLADKRARLGVSAFHTVYGDYQNAGYVGLQFLVNNAEKVIVDGVTANGDFVLGGGFIGSAAVTYLDARYDKYTGGACAYPTFLPSCDLSGRTLPYTADWRTNLGLQYKRSMSWGAVYGRADWAWSSKYMTNTNLDPRNVQKAHSLVNLRVGVEARGFDVAIFSNNLFNETVIAQDGVTNLFGTDPAFQRFLAAPREIGLSLRKTF